MIGQEIYTISMVCSYLQILGSFEYGQIFFYLFQSREEYLFCLILKCHVFKSILSHSVIIKRFLRLFRKQPLFFFFLCPTVFVLPCPFSLKTFYEILSIKISINVITYNHQKAFKFILLFRNSLHHEHQIYMLLIKIHKSKTHLEKIYAVPLLFKGRYTFTSIFVYYYFFIFLFLTLQNKKYNGIRTFLPILATVSDYGKKISTNICSNSSFRQ